MVMVDNMGNVSDMGRACTFTEDQMVIIVLWLGELKNVFKVRHKFAKHYGIACHSRKVPVIRSFQTVLGRFSKTGSTLDLEEIRRAVANVRKRAAACIECGGGHFEQLLKTAKNEAAEE